jgi:hypothetical protein
MKHRINFKFEKFSYDNSKSFQHNLYTGQIFNFFNLTPYRFSQVVESMIVSNQTILDSNETVTVSEINDTSIKNYIISTAVYYSNEQWAKKDESLFELLNPQYLKDLQNGNALLLIDQSVEGYQSNWLWAWFHEKCRTHNIDPRAIIYLTGNQLCEEQYDTWHCETADSLPKIKVIASTSLSFYIYQTYKNTHLDVFFDDVINFKRNNLTEIALFDSTNLRARPQRVFNFLNLIKSGLINYGKISMPAKKEWPHIPAHQFKKFNLSLDLVDNTMPSMTISHRRSTDTEYHQHITRILDDVYKTTWVSLITESSYFDYEHSVFISEKTFKPIACMQPFIIVGSKHTLKYLRKLGYRTFDGYIDESYDDLEDQERFLAVISALEKIRQIEDKVSWIESMREILEHNHRLFLSIGTTHSIEYQEITKYYANYFRDIT